MSPPTTNIISVHEIFKKYTLFILQKAFYTNCKDNFYFQILFLKRGDRIELTLVGAMGTCL